ncbi:hypothetical protein RZN22_03160, partial [Bacillaceae bacterium S4-13-58]
YTFLSFKKSASALRNKKGTCFCEEALSSFPSCDYSGQKLRRLIDDAFSLELARFYTLSFKKEEGLEYPNIQSLSIEKLY